MNFLNKVLAQASKQKKQLKPTYNGFTFREIADFENTIFEVHDLVRKKFEETKDIEYAIVALDCLKAINDMEHIKGQIVFEE